MVTSPAVQSGRVGTARPPPTSSDAPSRRVEFKHKQEAVVSFKPFLEAHSLKLWEYWGAAGERAGFIKPTFKAFFDEVRTRTITLHQPQPRPKP